MNAWWAKMDGEVVTEAEVAPTTLVRSSKLHGITARCNRCTAYLRRKWAEPEERASDVCEAAGMLM